MDSITLENYRCFGSRQTARLAPLTLLVGPNSAGKTSFLAAIRALWDVAFRNVAPDFRGVPYDLGSFQDIVHQKSGRGGQSACFEAGFEYSLITEMYSGVMRFNATFENRAEAPFPIIRRIARDDARVEVYAQEREQQSIYWQESHEEEWHSFPLDLTTYGDAVLAPLMLLTFPWEAMAEQYGDDLPANTEVSKNLQDLINEITRRKLSPQPFAGAPIRSRPLRTYDPVRPYRDPEGEYIPSYLASLSRRNPDEWQKLKGVLEKFGRHSGLFDDIEVKSFGQSGGDPFQIQIRKSGKRRKGPWRNLIDVGYGVSQVLPVLAELLSAEPPPMSLLQQPEVHLHPSAQAELGTLFCSVAAGGRQLVIETHSDYIIDRVRMDVRDGATGLKPEDVSILYFEPGDLEVKIHSIRLDQMGNVLDAPPGYRQFFMEEVRRSIGI